jgi:hypothetical protein
MVADTAITGPTMGSRDRQYKVKIEPIQQSALIGFAGDPLAATRAIRAAAGMHQGPQTVDYLLQEHLRHAETDFMYAYVEKDAAHLFCVTEGTATESSAAHIGMHEAFSAFQEIKLARTLNPVPGALEKFIAGVVETPAPSSKDKPKLYEDVTEATIAMQKLFYKSSDRGVGGTAIPYVVTTAGARVYGYGYSVTDPGINALKPGSLINHGTAQFGGYGVSVTELRERDGIVIYWLQRPGGTVWLKADDWYQPHDFPGAPSAFKEAVRASLGREVDIWFGDGAQGTPESFRVLRDHAGRPRLTVAQSGRSLSFSWIQGSADDFSISSPVIKIDEGAMASDQDTSNEKIIAKCSGDKLAAILTIAANAESPEPIQLSADELDKFIHQLARVRSEMTPQVPVELGEGTALDTVIDPAWQTRPLLHPALPGRLLALRHQGLGWLSFLLPPNEAAALGALLVTKIEGE